MDLVKLLLFIVGFIVEFKVSSSMPINKREENEAGTIASLKESVSAFSALQLVLVSYNTLILSELSQLAICFSCNRKIYYFRQNSLEG